MIGYPLDSHVKFDPDGTPIFDRAISSAPLRKLYKSLFSDGILPNPSTNLQVSTGEGMNVIVSPGFALCNGCMKLEEAQRTLAVQASSAAYDRIDTVVLRLNDNDADRICDLYIIQGIPAVSPVRPELTRTESIWELGLADLFIAKNSTAISNQRITDTRYETPRCGVISSISRFDTEKLYQQVQADLSDFRANEQAAFVAWFAEMRDQLSTDAAGNLFEMIQELKRDIDEKDISTNPVEFESGDDVDPEGYTEVAVIKSGDLFKDVLHKITTMAKNVRYLWRMLGETDISQIGDGTVTGAIDTLNDNFVRWAVNLQNSWSGILFCTANLKTGQVTMSGYLDGRAAINAVFCPARSDLKTAYTVKAAVLPSATTMSVVRRDTKSFATISNYANGYLVLGSGYLEECRYVFDIAIGLVSHTV